jgi:hypothetical protein
MTIILQSRHEEPVEFEEVLIKQSSLLSSLYESHILLNEMKLKDFDIKEILLLREFMIENSERPLGQITAPLKDRLENTVPKWYSEFLGKLKNQDIISLLKLSDYLHVESLTDLLCAKIASLAMESSTQEMEGMFKNL